MSAILHPVLSTAAERARRERTVPEVNEAVKSIKPYVATSSLDKIAQRPEDVAYKLDWNESTIAPSPRVREALAGLLAGGHPLNWYPEQRNQKLMSALSAYTGLDAESILVTNGSDDALELVCKTFLNNDDEVIVPSPTYTHFLVFAGAMGAKLIRVYNDEPMSPNLKMILQALTYDSKLLYLVNPNNPTGVMYTEEQIRLILETAPHTVVIVDEAYYEFAGTSMAHLVNEYENLVVTRTFSKSFGIAGLRIGYLLASPRLVVELTRLHNPKSVNLFAQVAAEAALSDLEYLHRYVDQVTQSKRILVDFLRSRGVHALETPANYVLVRVHDTRRFCQLLEDENVYVHDRNEIPQMKGFIRMSVGTVEQTHEIIARMERVLDRDFSLYAI